ncbi:hypothetical protein [Methylobacterium sp. J-070]|uniref:hypothetical protein n=1 Tax=Methylobacterium sp. J-070 TaxID=2836650 RepID=UPI001FBA36C9|nr:hypothetical protein [Methylobacterium sp. J-070]MCJ2052130.1 hypothetical protein [Methylobacterium sp. J-070]
MIIVLALIFEYWGAPMAAWSPSITCHFMRKLVIILSEDQSTMTSTQDALLFNRLLELEMDAERQGAEEASCRIIARVRRIAGTAASRAYPPTIRGH